MSGLGEVIDAIVRAVPAHQPSLSSGDIDRLRELTRELLSAKPDATTEYARFLSIRQRGLCLPEAQLTERLAGATIMVTGGTGCIGSSLMTQLAARNPGRLVSVSRGVTTPWTTSPGAEYLQGDVRDRARLDELVGQVRPDVIFHVTAQRSPALAEVEVHRTVTTNVLGSRNVLAAAAAAGVPQVVCASTGKALRPYSPETYTASEARAMLGRFRLAAARHPGDQRVARLIAELRRDSPEVRDWWPAHDVTPIGGEGVKKLRHPRFGPAEYSHVILQVADNPDQVLVSYSLTEGNG